METVTRKSISRQQGAPSKRNLDAFEVLERSKKNLIFRPSTMAFAVRYALSTIRKPTQ